MSAPSGDSGERVLLARITGVHGLKGEVKIATFTAEPEDVAAYGPLTSADGSITFEIASLRLAGGGAVVARLRGVADRNAAESCAERSCSCSAPCCHRRMRTNTITRI